MTKVKLNIAEKTKGSGNCKERDATTLHDVQSTKSRILGMLEKNFHSVSLNIATTSKTDQTLANF